MDNLEAWIDFRTGERMDYTPPRCYWCGKACSGDATTDVDGKAYPVCDTWPCAEVG
jgi:hypothetical protein